ncbi:MAG: prepilin-type N-terminal cleavage/methylation domain-containing protein [Deltaproteobacteria bacterium]|nr:prepilin-type N-terminal cleavage/methylation domain-containing protein [Deltaproteobacteria bacterium]MCL5891790.1 prepilin-type N-terminal cleavage/methylation domain-containing protein [Deltaproteobacteria bacterium]
MNKNIVKINNKGASLLEVMIAMVILTVAFLGIMALSISLLNNNALSTKINTATSIAQAQVSQLNCLGTTNVPSSFTPSPLPVAACPAGDTCYKYEITPTVLNPVTNTDTRTNVTACINPVLAVSGDAPGEFPPTPANPGIGGIGITVPYTVTITLAPNPTNPSAINAQVDVGWQDTGQHVITMYDIIS